MLGKVKNPKPQKQLTAHCSIMGWYISNVSYFRSAFTLHILAHVKTLMFGTSLFLNDQLSIKNLCLSPNLAFSLTSLSLSVHFPIFVPNSFIFILKGNRQLLLSCCAYLSVHSIFILFWKKRSHFLTGWNLSYLISASNTAVQLFVCIWTNDKQNDYIC